VLQGRKSKIAGAIALGGVHFVAPAAFAPLVATIVAGAFAWATIRAAVREKKKISLTRWAIVAGGALGVLAAYSALRMRDRTLTSGGVAQQEIVDQPNNAEDYRRMDELRTIDKSNQITTKGLNDNNFVGALTGNYGGNGAPYQQLAGQIMGQGGLEGVAPVALPLPNYARAVHDSRELVSKGRPFSLRLYYVTDLALLPLGGAWLAAIAALAWLHRAQLRAARDKARAWLASTTPTPPEPAPAAPPAE
jgi:hypothetical protein